jgi:hypothetical protein
MLPPLYEAAAGPLDNALQVFSALTGVASFIAGVAWAIRPQTHVREVPWWWWCGDALALSLLAFGNDFGLLQGTLLVAGAFSLGIGVATFSAAYREGRIRLRRPRPASFAESMAATDWAVGGALVRVLEVTPGFENLTKANPYIDLHIRMVNVSLYLAVILGDVQGRILIPDEGLTLREQALPPELRTISRTATSGQPGMVYRFDDAQSLERTEFVLLTLRQYLNPEVRDTLLRWADKHVIFDLSALDIGVVLQRLTAGGESEQTDRKRLALESYKFEIPPASA